MKILHTTDVYLPRLGGIEMQVRDLARQHARDHDVRVLTSTAPGTRPDTDGFAVTRVHRSLLLSSDGPPVPSDVDVVHCHSSTFSPLAWATARNAVQQGIPTVLTMHSFVPASGPVADLLRWVAASIGPGALWSAVSTAAAAALQPLVPTEVLVLPNGVDADGWVKAAPGTHEVPTVVSVMRLARRKRPVPFVDLVAAVRERTDRPFRVVIAGDGRQAGAVARAVRRRGLSEVVSLAGRMTRPQVATLLAASDVYVAPAHLESFGIAALEARCAGLPVVAMAASGVSDFVAHGEDGLLAADDAEMADAIAALVQDPALMRRIGEHNRTTGVRVGWSTLLPRYEEVYAVAGAPARSATPPGTRPLVAS